MPIYGDVRQQRLSGGFLCLQVEVKMQGERGGHPLFSAAATVILMFDILVDGQEAKKNAFARPSRPADKICVPTYIDPDGPDLGKLSSIRLV